MPGAGSKWALWVERERGLSTNEEPLARAKVTPTRMPFLPPQPSSLARPAPPMAPQQQQQVSRSGSRAACLAPDSPPHHPFAAGPWANHLPSPLQSFLPRTFTEHLVCSGSGGTAQSKAAPVARHQTSSPPEWGTHACWAGTLQSLRERGRQGKSPGPRSQLPEGSETASPADAWGKSRRAAG